jgi:hypothetical protein
MRHYRNRWDCRNGVQALGRISVAVLLAVLLFSALPQRVVAQTCDAGATLVLPTTPITSVPRSLGTYPYVTYTQVASGWLYINGVWVNTGARRVLDIGVAITATDFNVWRIAYGDSVCPGNGDSGAAHAYASSEYCGCRAGRQTTVCTDADAWRNGCGRAGAAVYAEALMSIADGVLFVLVMPTIIYVIASLIAGMLP